jgi:hypothetical protein
LLDGDGERSSVFVFWWLMPERSAGLQIMRP